MNFGPAETVHLTQIAQIAITVSDLPRSTAFYRDTLGLTFLFDAGSMAFLQCGNVRTQGIDFSLLGV